MRIFFSIIVFFLPLCVQASALDSLKDSISDFFSDDKSYIETTKSIKIDESQTIEDFSILMFESIYFIENNNFPTLATLMFTNDKKLATAFEVLLLGNTDPFKNYLKTKNLNVIKLDPKDIIWEIDGKTNVGKVVLAHYQDYVVRIQTEMDGDYITVNTDDISVESEKISFNYNEIEDRIDISSATLYVGLINDRD